MDVDNTCCQGAYCSCHIQSVRSACWTRPSAGVGVCNTYLHTATDQSTVSLLATVPLQNNTDSNEDSCTIPLMLVCCQDSQNMSAGAGNKAKRQKASPKPINVQLISPYTRAAAVGKIRRSAMSGRRGFSESKS